MNKRQALKVLLNAVLKHTSHHMFLNEDGDIRASNEKDGINPHSDLVLCPITSACYNATGIMYRTMDFSPAAQTLLGSMNLDIPHGIVEISAYITRGADLGTLLRDAHLYHGSDFLDNLPLIKAIHKLLLRLVA